jgi:hypothetical protein
MELSEDLQYRLAFLTIRLAFDQKLSSGDPGRYPAMLQYLDILAGTQLADGASGKLCCRSGTRSKLHRRRVRRRDPRAGDQGDRRTRTRSRDPTLLRACSARPSGEPGMGPGAASPRR